MPDIILTQPSRRELYGKVVEIIFEVDHRKSSRILGNAYDLAKGICDKVFASEAGLLNYGGICHDFSSMCSAMGVAWVTRHKTLSVRIYAQRQQGKGKVIRDNQTPLSFVFEDRIKKIREKISKKASARVVDVVGDDPSTVDCYYDTSDADGIDRTWASTPKAIICSHRNEYYLAVRGYVVMIPDWLSPQGVLWNRLQFSEERIRRAKKWAIESGKMPEGPMDDFVGMLEDFDEHKTKAIKAIKHLMHQHGIVVEDLT